ncbi:MAG: peptidoglycan DD-metalloendopeptidase family protein [Brumimicrobium sp.]
MSISLERSLRNHFRGFNPVVEFLNHSDYIFIDLSVKSKLLDKIDIYHPKLMDDFIKNNLILNKKKVAYGGYLEKRNLYERSDHFNSDNKRNIHLGIDLWCPVNTNVLSPLNAEIHSFKNNLNFGDYGPTIILKHKLDNYFFFTLYGHLSEESIDCLSVGDKIKKGDIIAQIGDDKVNGNYAPHLHFQIIKDLELNKGDYPGVCNEDKRSFYMNNCPDPNLLLGL